MARKLQADEVAESAEKQLMELQLAKSSKIKKFINDRNDIVSRSRTVQTIMYAVATTYKEVFPGAEGFIELRIKSPDSIETKAINDFTEFLDEIQLNKGADQSEVIKKISEKNIKDILAFTVITTKPPEKFRTGDDALNKKLTQLANELKETDSRLQTHKEFIDSNEKKMKDLDDEMIELRTDIFSELLSDDLTNALNDLLNTNLKDDEDAKNKVKNLKNLITENNKKMYSNGIKDKVEQYGMMEEHVEYGKTNLDRTQKTYDETLRELQYEMSSYFISNLAKFSTFKFWGTERLEDPKQIQKPGFRTMKSVYGITFSNKIGKSKIGFEAQGKGALDYYDSEFRALGAIYHEEQKTKDGIISKKTDMPDFTIIGDKQTKKIEEDTRRKYTQIVSIDDLIELSDNDELTRIYKELKDYEEKITEEMASKYGDNYLAKSKIKSKMNTAFNAAKENLIQNEIEEKIIQSLHEFADTEKVKNRIQKNEELKRVYDEELKELEKANKDKEKNEHDARVRVLYYAKEHSILDYAKKSIPIFSRVDISNDLKEPVVYTFTVGESIYRYFYNKLNGLKDENGNYQFKPQEQQKRALLKLSGLFKLEEDFSNFYTYSQKTKKFTTLDTSNIRDNKESLELDSESDEIGEL